MAAMTGLLILGYFVFATNSHILASGASAKEADPVWWRPLLEFVPRLSLVVIIELLAYFFLRLYKASLDNIKYFQNELTNAESKFLGFDGALSINDTESIRDAISSFSKTERNFVLKKDESTVDIEKSKLENSMIKELVSAVTGVVSTPKNKGKEK